MHKRLVGAASAAILLAITTGAQIASASRESGSPGGYFPKTWTSYAANPEHNAVFDLPPSAPEPIRNGVSWQFKERLGLPLDGGPKDEDVLGYLRASVKTTQTIGNAVGVTAADGKIFAESDANRVYALDPLTGHKIWESETVNEAMGNPVVADGLVFVGAGDTGFSFSGVQQYAKGQQVSRGMGFAAVSAFDEGTGKEVWHFSTKGEDMPSVVYLDGRVYFGNGDGHMYALDAKSGRQLWATHVGGFDSMSSANYWRDPDTGRALVLAGFTNPNYLYAFDAETGKVAWKSTVAGIFNTGMGDNTPAVDSKRGIVFQDSVVDFDASNKTADLTLFAVDARTGTTKWETKLGRGPLPPAYKASIAMVHDGVVYLGNPATGTETAVDETTGHILWQTDLGTYTWRGTTYHIQNRAGPALYRGVLYQPAGAYIFSLDPHTGKILDKYEAGGRYGIVNPVITGGTMYLDNSWNWVQAIPMSTIYPDWATHANQ